MNLLNQLNDCCLLIASNKVQERRRNIDTLYNLLDNKNLLVVLSDEENLCKWFDIMESIHSYLTKEAEKMNDDEKKKNKIICKARSDLLSFALNRARTICGSKLDIQGILRLVMEVLDSFILKKYYLEKYLMVLNIILADSQYSSKITFEQWTDLLQHLKKLDYLNDTKVLSCLRFIYKWAPLHKYPLCNLRNEFQFVNQLCQSLQDSLLKNHKIEILELLVDFCRKNSSDSCFACCKLAEEVFVNLRSLYQPVTTDNAIKELLFEFFALQTKLHHPKGVLANDRMSYAFSWSDWKKQLSNMYFIINSEMKYQLRCGEKLSFLTSDVKKANKMQKTFISFCIVVFRQVFNLDLLNITQISLGDDSDQEPMLKRQRVDISFEQVLQMVKETQSWQWIYIVTEYLQEYPCASHKFHNLFQVIVNTLQENQDSNVVRHCYRCLDVLLDSEENFNEEIIIDGFNRVYESTLRCIGLNHNINETHKLLQKMLVRNKVRDVDRIYETFSSGAILLTPQALRNFKLLAKLHNIPELASSNTSYRKSIVKWILNADDERHEISNAYRDISAAEILIHLCLKQWPKDTELLKSDTGRYESFEDVYEYNAFKKLILPGVRGTGNHSERISALNEEILRCLMQYLETFAINTLHKHHSAWNVKDIGRKLCFYNNLLTVIDKYNLLGDFDGILVKIKYEELFVIFTAPMVNLNGVCSSGGIKECVEALSELNCVLSGNFSDFVSRTCRNNISVDLLQCLFGIINDKTDENPNTNALNELKILCVDILSNFCFHPNCNVLTEVQEQVLDTLTEPKYDTSNPLDYKMVSTFLSHIKKCLPGVLSDEVLSKILNLIQHICYVHFAEFDAVLEVLVILKELAKNIVVCRDKEIRGNYFKIICNFYELKENYGYQFSLSLLKLFGYLIDNVNSTYSIDDDTNLLMYIPEFLASNYQEVRLQAIKYLSHVFTLDGFGDDTIFIMQRDLFKLINVKSHEAFRIEIDEMEEGRKVDEIVCRTASVLHTYASLIVSSSIWRRKLLYFLIHTVHDRKIDVDSLNRILNLVSAELNFPNKDAFLSAYTEYLFNEWCSDGKDIIEFPFDILGFGDYTEFCRRHVEIIIPLLIGNRNTDAIQRICEMTSCTLAELYEKHFSVIIVTTLQCQIKDPTNIIPYKNVEDILSPEKTRTLLLEKMANIISYLIKTIADEAVFERQFDLPYKLLKDNEDTTLTNFEDAVLSIQKKLKINISIIDYLSTNHPDKIQTILLDLYMNIYKKSTPEDKLKCLHQYTTYIDTLSDYISTNHRISTYLIRTVIHSLLNFTSTQTRNTFNIAACKYLHKLCIEITNKNSELLTRHLTVIANGLTPLINTEDDLSQECLNLLRYLLVENSRWYRTAIQNLDPFPSSGRMDEINEICTKIRSEVVCGTLDGEIKHFLRAGELKRNAGSRVDALKHLKFQLSSRKDELKLLCDKSKDIKGFTLGSCDSTVHSLILMLLNLSKSGDNKVAAEAARCLGELGPLDLATLILQSKKPHKFPAVTPFQLLTSHIIDLLSTYIIDEDHNLVYISSNILYEVLNSKEGKHYIDNLENAYNKEFLHPFVSKNRMKQSIVQLSNHKIDENIVQTDSWYPKGNHQTWIKELTTKLLECFTDKCFLDKLIPICKLKTSFCEEILPHIIHLIVSDKHDTIVEAVVTKINSFFQELCNVISGNDTANDYVKTSVQCMLNVIHFLRLNNKEISQLPLNYLKIARAACYCSNYFAALLYVELWSTQTRTVNPGGPTILETICEHEDANTANMVETILKQSYSALGELDALYGCNFANIIDLDDRMEHFKQLGKWGEVLLHYDMQVGSGQHEKSLELIDSLKNCGFYHLATNYDESQQDYECLWRLGRYDTDFSKAKPISNYDKYKYEALKQLQENDEGSFVIAVDKARQNITDTLKRTSLESTKALYNCLMKLQSLKELEDVAVAIRESDFEDLLSKWQGHDQLDKVNFKYVEPIKAQRISILNIYYKNNVANFRKALIDAHLDLAKSARSDGYFNIAMRTINNLAAITKGSKEYDNFRIFEEAQICWSMGNTATAKFLMKHLFKINQDDVRLKFASLKLYGTWMAETHSENPDTILNEYFLEPLKLMKRIELSLSDREGIFLIYDIIARFSDAEYQRILSYMKSAEFERKVKNMEKSKETAGKIEAQSRRLDYDQKKAVTVHKKQSLIDETEIENTRKEKDAYFKLAIKYYLLNLQHSDINNIRTFRILSLWLENRAFKGLDQMLRDFLPKIPSYKFVSILPQLAPHLTNNTSDEFGNHIFKIIERCARDHPHHTLPIILALVNSDKDSSYSKSSVTTEGNETRILGARYMLEKLKETTPQLRSTIEEMEFVADALIEFAYTPHESCQKTKKDGTCLIPSNLKIQKIKNYTNMLLTTCSLTLNKSCNYNNVIGIHSYSQEFQIVGGINNPKRLFCRGTDGIVRSQLLKGKDDLRQDAVMEQVFENINKLLHSNKQTRHLLIRTYKVVPLSKRSGVLEWVEGSIKIGDYLIDAHTKYNPKDLKPSTCRVAIQNVAKKSTDEKLKKFKEICQNFKPVFHKFFETNYIEPLMWYERKRAYMYSVATTSMCGYILGLGDRHLQNILLDEFTAEVIHIDFGIAFEQGRVLPTPETVPFRLTRDIEDPMGVAGIEGVFRKACEKTMEVLRKNRETIVTILEVLLYDPLYEWTISPSEAYSLQFNNEDGNDTRNSAGNSDDETVNVNVSAERALLRLRQKLHGTEEGGTSSVEGQVEKLLQQARDPSNLCRLFYGWQSFL